jgi:glycosyltransferase involved in cell wall biosynthesis
MKESLDRIQRHKTLCLPNPSLLPILDRSQPNVRSNQGLRVGIFGGQESRVATIKAHTNLIRTMHNKNLLASAMLLGKGSQTGKMGREDVQLLERYIPYQRIEVRSAQSSDDASKFLGRADVYLSHSSGQLACKSSAFMAALAIGCPSVLCDGGNAEPLREGEHFIASNDSPQSVKRFEDMAITGHLARISTAARSWYERNADWKVIARQYWDAICHETLYDGERLINKEARNSLQTQIVEATPMGAC